MILHCMGTGSLVSSTLQVVTTFFLLVIMDSSRYMSIAGDVCELISMSFNTNQILWNEDEDESEEFTKLNGPLVPHYHRRFTVHFAKNASRYEPTIVCYIPKESRLQVMYSCTLP